MTRDEKGKEIWSSMVSDLIEQYFPKGKCKERGQALMLVALIYCKVLLKLCENCKEEKLNTVAKYFKKYNRSLKPRISEGKLANIILENNGRDYCRACDPSFCKPPCKAIKDLAHAITQAEEIIK